MQPMPELVSDGELVIPASNASQSRGSHGAFRYFGKLAPDVTGAVLDIALGDLEETHQPEVLDPMCGSGTTLLEAHDRGAKATGLDVNPVALLYANVKTRSIDVNRALSWARDIADSRTSLGGDPRRTFAATRNADRWFTQEAQEAVSGMMTAIDRLPPTRERDFLKAVLLSRLRRISNASARTGRIFYDPESAVRPYEDFLKGVEDVAPRLPRTDVPCHIEHRDARSPLGHGLYDLVFIHPPYFALYRYSSDVLRFEMEIGGYSRRDTAKLEVAEGWKSGDPCNLETHVTDMQAVMSSAKQALRPNGVLALVTSNSTLGDREMPVIDRLVSAANEIGLVVSRHLVRKAHFGSASYHKSARADKVIQQDHVIFFRR